MDWEIVWESVPLIWKGAGATVTMFAWALVIGTAGAFALSLMRLSPAKPLQWFADRVRLALSRNPAAHPPLLRLLRPAGARDPLEPVASPPSSGSACGRRPIRPR